MAGDRVAPEPTEPRPQAGNQGPGKDPAVLPGVVADAREAGEQEQEEGPPILPEALADARLRLEIAAEGLEFRPFDDRLEVLLPPEQLLQICRVIRDHLGYGMLTSATAVDWKMSFELVYHIHRLDSPYPLVLRCSLPHEQQPKAPSLVPVWAGAAFQEREIFDLMGIVFTGHPDLRRILLDDDFPGHPLRKDFEPDPDYVLMRHLRVPGYPGATPGLASTGRFPDGEGERTAGGDNARATAGQEQATAHRSGDSATSGLVQEVPEPRPQGTTPETAGKAETPQDEGIASRPPAAIACGERTLSTFPLDADDRTLVVNFGPQHPSTHGVFRLVMKLEGETVVDAVPMMGYLHRGIEKLCESRSYIQCVPFTDRLDYLAPLSANLAYALAVERLAGIEIPERADYIRVIMVELNRIASHCMAIGSLANDAGAFYTPFIYAFRDREKILDLFEMASGQRMTPSYIRFGGVSRDLPDGFVPNCWKLMDEMPRNIDEYERMLSTNEIFLARTRNVGVLPPERAVDCSVTGPVLRASGVRYDLRKAEPFTVYERFQFDVPVGTVGDSYDRYIVRIREMRESVKIVKQALHDLPKGDVRAPLPKVLRPPAGDAYAQVESPKGVLGFYLVSDGGPTSYRTKIRAPSFINLTALGSLLVGHKVADAIVILGSFDMVLGEVDR